MSTSKGFTLIEITVVLVIIGLVAQTAKSNLLALAAAQQKFNEDYNGSYCISTGANPTGQTPLCGDTYVDLNINLHLSMGGGNDPFTYSCSATAETIPYNCTATDGTVSLTIDENNPIPAGNTCTGSSQLPVCCTAGGGACPY